MFMERLLGKFTNSCVGSLYIQLSRVANLSPLTEDKFHKILLLAKDH